MKPRAYVLIETDLGMAAKVVDELLKVEGVHREATSAVSGPYDIVCLVEGETHNALGRAVVDKVQSIPGVRRTLTCFWVKVD